MKKTKKKGFTLVELLVVIAIIGLLATLAVVSLNSARQKARDANRVSDMRQLQTAWELHYDAKNSSYVITACGVDWPAAVSECTTAGELIAYLPDIANLNDPSQTSQANANLCTGTSTGTCNYGIPSAPTATAYIVYFYLESGTGGYGSGAHSLDQAGMH